MYLATNIRALRKQRGIDQAELGKAIGVSQKSVSKYENGDRQPTYKTLIRMKEYFNVSLDQLVLFDLSGDGRPE